jgi:hypothetical protein
MWGNIVDSISGLMGKLSPVVATLSTVLNLLRKAIRVGLSSSELAGVLRIRDGLRLLANVFRDMAQDIDDVASEIDQAVSAEGDGGTAITFDEGLDIADEGKDLAQYPSRFKEATDMLMSGAKELM